MNIIPRRDQQCRRSMYLSSQVVGVIERELEHDLRTISHELTPPRRTKTCVKLQCNKTSISAPYVLKTLETARQTQELLRSKEALQSRAKKFWSQVKRGLAYGIYKYFGLVHLLYFLAVALLGSLFIYAVENFNSSTAVEYVDALFMSVSCVGTSGLMTVDYHPMTKFSKIVLGVLSVLGSPVFDSIVIMIARYFLWSSPYVTQNLDATLRSSSSSSTTTDNINEDDTLTDFKVVQFHAHIANRYEKSALKVMIASAVTYWITIQTVVFLVLAVLIKRTSDSDYWSDSFFLTVGSFSGVGLSPFESSVRPFHRHPAILLVLILSMALGNSLLPLGLRVTVWLIHNVAFSKTRAGESGWYKLERLTAYILALPRRITFAVLPVKQTVYLCATLVAIDIAAVCSILAADSKLVSGDDAVTRFVNALFEAVNTRNCGFSATASSQVSPCTMVLFCVLMYLGPIPSIVFMRSSRDRGEFEDETRKRGHERGGYNTDLNVDNDEDDDDEYGPFKRELLNEGAEFHLKRLVFYDSVWIFVSWYFLCLIENESIKEDSNFDIFKFLFEVISAYSMVGLSLGYKYVTHSLSDTLRPLSKVILIAVMMVGRHRFLPDNIDQAVLPACMPLDNARVSNTTLGDSLRGVLDWAKGEKVDKYYDIDGISLSPSYDVEGSGSGNGSSSVSAGQPVMKSALKKKGAGNKQKKSVRFNLTPEYFESDDDGGGSGKQKNDGSEFVGDDYEPIFVDEDGNEY